MEVTAHGATVPGGVRFDDQGKIVPHSILGSVEDLKKYLEANGDSELLRKLAVSEMRQQQPEPVGVEEGRRGEGQSSALQHWHAQMSQRRRQREHLSNRLGRPPQALLMNQADWFRSTQEQRELLSRAASSGCGSGGSREFWRLPQHLGDDVSGIAATLTLSQRGQHLPVTHIGQPSTVRQETGGVSGGPWRLSSRTWDRSAYLQQQQQEMREVLKTLDFNQPEIDALQVIGSSKPVASVTATRRPSLDKEAQEEEEVEEEEKEEQEEQNCLSLPSSPGSDGSSDQMPFPALRVCGQLATWTGDGFSHQGHVGVSARLSMEAVPGEVCVSVVELVNQGCCALLYRWQQLALHPLLPGLPPEDPSLFCFDCRRGSILPGQRRQLQVSFLPRLPGVARQLWQLHTRPGLVGGASVQLLLRGVALCRDHNAQERSRLQRDQERTVILKLCRSLVEEVVGRVRSPPPPPAPTQQASLDSSTQQEGSEAVQDILSADASERLLSVQDIGRELWKQLLDKMICEAARMRRSLGLPEVLTWSPLPPENEGEDEEAAKAKEVKEIEDNTTTINSTTNPSEKPVILPGCSEESVPMRLNAMQTYRTTLHIMVCGMLEQLVWSLCGLTDEYKETPRT